MTLQLQGSAGFAPSVRYAASRYPVIIRLVPQTLSGPKNIWGTYYLLRYFNMRNIENNFKSVSAGVNKGETVEFIEGDFLPLDLPTILDTSYHRIATDGKRILVILK